MQFPSSPPGWEPFLGSFMKQSGGHPLHLHPRMFCVTHTPVTPAPYHQFFSTDRLLAMGSHASHSALTVDGSRALHAHPLHRSETA
jgi:hypothetical protein